MTDAARPEKLTRFLAASPFVKTLGMVCDIKGDEMTAILPFAEKLIGSTALRALHGGAIGSFLELTAMSQVYLLSEIDTLPRPINLTIDYLRSARAEPLYARAHITKMGRRIANVRCEAWQSHRVKPVASLHAHFLITPPDAPS